MAKCTACGKQISAEERESRKEVLDLLGVGKRDNHSTELDNLFRSLASATQAWQCDRWSHVTNGSAMNV
jgi:hypothetical protein